MTGKRTIQTIENGSWCVGNNSFKRLFGFGISFSTNFFKFRWINVSLLFCLWRGIDFRVKEEHRKNGLRRLVHTDRGQGLESGGRTSGMNTIFSRRVTIETFFLSYLCIATPLSTSSSSLFFESSQQCHRHRHPCASTCRISCVGILRRSLHFWALCTAWQPS